MTYEQVVEALNLLFVIMCYTGALMATVCGTYLFYRDFVK